MHLRKNAAALLLGLLALFFGAGCGGGDQSGEQQGGQQGGQRGRAEPADSKIAIGTIRAVNEDKGKISLKPATQEGEAEPVTFKVNERSRISLNGEQREVGEIQGGQQAQVEYVDRERGADRAVSIDLFATGGQQPQEGEQTN